MITVTPDQFEDLRLLAIEAKDHKSKDSSYQRGVNLLGAHLLKKLDKLHKPKKICSLCKKDDNGKNQ